MSLAQTRPSAPCCARRRTPAPPPSCAICASPASHHSVNSHWRQGWRSTREELWPPSLAGGGSIRNATCASDALAARPNPRRATHPLRALDDRQSATTPADAPSPSPTSSPASQPAAASAVVAERPSTVPLPALSPSVLLAEGASGQLLANAKRVFPKIPWGPFQLVQVMAWSGALAVVGAATTVQTPQASVLADTALRSAAVRHLGLEALCCCLAAAVLFMGLRQSRPRAAGHFSFALDPQVALTAAALAAVAYPLADPLMHELWLGVEQVTGLSALLPDPGAALVDQLRGCEEAGDGVSLALHAVASCVVGPLWEETFWRGFFLASMTRVLPLPACVALSSGAFAALHLGPGTLLPIAFLSAICDMLYLRTASLAAPLAFHAGWNAFQLAGILLVGKDAFV